MEITGLSMAAHARPVVDPAEANKVLHIVRIFRVTPTIISVLDYSKGFGHTDLVTC